VRRIAVFAKWPERGLVKTRLSPALPAELAVELQRAMLEDALDAVARSTATERFLYWDGAPEDSGGSTPAPFQGRRQQGLDLGARLERAFDEMLAGGEGGALVIGADCPDLDAASIDLAFDALAAHDLVVGPTRDGGYYLIGVRRPTPEIFRGIAWSTGRVFQETVERSSAANLSWRRLGELDDVDTPEDLVRLLRAALDRSDLAGSSRHAGSHTTAALRAMKLLPG
jgi:rSAM/selenodomain-associated transferase 1